MSDQLADSPTPRSAQPSAPSPHLAELSIRDFAIVDELHIEWPPGFIVITGETGAGKSIIIDAVGATLGDRFDSSWLRAGAERAMVEAIFWDVAADEPLARTLTEIGCDVDGDQVVLTRDVQATRSVARVNGRAVPLSTVQQIASRLVDVHSQASHLSLSRVAEHVLILDRFAHTEGLRAEVAEAARAIRTVQREIERLVSGDRQAQREGVLLRHEVDEIDAAALQVGEEEALTAQRSRLRNALRLRQLATGIHDALQGGEEGAGALELLSSAVAQVEEIRSLDPAFPGAAEPVIEALDAAESLAREARRYVDSLEEDPEALDALEERLLLIADLKRKYGATIEDVLAYREMSAARLEAVEHSEERIEALRVEEATQRRQLGELAGRLTALRTEAAHRLEDIVQGEMGELGMPGARFGVALTQKADPTGVEVGLPEPVAFDETGVDRVELLMSANPGEPPRPLAQVASGGELARFMLALKTALSAVDETPILVFDELDQGIGGRMGHVVGEKLWELSHGHQVICITHLPQVAAYADAHYVVTKQPADGRTVTRVDRVLDDSRAREIALMLGGHAASGAALEAATELLNNAAHWKALRAREATKEPRSSR
jgi:DNA repair protein RecN (Recombination protein N)